MDLFDFKFSNFLLQFSILGLSFLAQQDVMFCKRSSLYEGVAAFSLFAFKSVQNLDVLVACKLLKLFFLNCIYFASFVRKC